MSTQTTLSTVTVIQVHQFTIVHQRKEGDSVREEKGEEAERDVGGVGY